MHLKIPSAKWRPFCPGGDELKGYVTSGGHCWDYYPGNLLMNYIADLPIQMTGTVDEALMRMHHQEHYSYIMKMNVYI